MMQYTIEKIAGIDCIFAPMQDTNAVTIEIMVKAGSIYETRETNGISHFLEHMFFKGGKKYPTPKSVAEQLDKFGGEFNAYTSNNYAGYYVKAAPEFAIGALDVLGDMMVGSKFPKEELEREKGVVIQEIKMYEDNPARLVHEKRGEYYYGDNSYGRTILGPESNILAMNQDKLFQHKDNLYTKDNMVVLVAGKIENKEAIKEKIAEELGSLPEKRKTEKPLFQAILPNVRKDFYDKKTEQNHMIISASGFDGNNEERYAANILSTILGGNMSSRLFQNIREKEGLCYYIMASHSTRPEEGTFQIRAGMDKKRFDFAVKRVHEEIDAIAKGDISQQEFDNSIGYMKGQIQMGIESSDEMATFLGNQYLLYNEVKTLDDMLQKYQNLTLENVKSVANKLNNENLYLYWIQ